MNNHISDIYIKSFKGISNLELQDIKLINILTGGNNSGKTSVLEVIQNMKNSSDFRMRYISEEVREDKKFADKIIYVSPIRHAEGDFCLSQILDYPEMYEQMLQVLKEYDKDIISINYDDNERGTYKILTKSNKKELPLNAYGNGMKKAILLMSAVIAAKDGILLLDEFETAIHTSAMNKTFKWVIESCKKLNVQVFMTSHSKEAIDKVLKCSPECIDDIALYTLYKDSEGTSVRRLDGKMAIEAQDEMGLELR